MQTGSARMCKKQSFLRTLKIVFPILLGLLTGFCSAVLVSIARVTGIISNGRMSGHRCAAMGRLQKKILMRRQFANNHHMAIISVSGIKRRNLKSCPLKSRMNSVIIWIDFNSLPPEDRTLYQKRFDQMQQLPPDERNDVRNKLRRMDRLSPREKEEIRRKFE